MANTAITDLPIDILYTLFPYLSVLEFLNFTSSCKAFASYRLDPTFWRKLTETTFRIPSQPLLQAGGARWQWLYKRLLTQTQLYTWGNNDRGSLGLLRGHSSASGSFGRTTVIHHAPFPQRVNLSAADVGVVADVQCGGWSTTLLNSIGILYLVGNFDGLSFNERGDTRMKQLAFPAGYPPTTNARYEPSTAIRQYSTGRSHVLGLADDGKVWSWARTEACQIKLLHVDLTDRNVLRVVAGWDRSSLYVKGTGIVYWPPKMGRLEQGEDTLVIDSTTIPGTGHVHKANERDYGSDLGYAIGEVRNHIVLEGYIVFTTNLNKVFAWSTSTEADLSQPRPFELTTFYPTGSSSPFQICDIQGSFRSFAIFTAAGDVLTAYRPLLETFFLASSAESPSPDPLPQPSRIASLQNQDVVSLAFGDYHVHALHTNGTISSFDKDPQHVGAFGLGNAKIAMFRGVQNAPHNDDGVLNGSKRRTVWFESLMETRMRYLYSQDKPQVQVALDEEVISRIRHDNKMRQIYGDHFEAEGRRWENGVSDENEMGAYFALKVAAAGWHSAALVLVDEDKAERVRQKHVLPPPAKPDQGVLARWIGKADESFWSSIWNTVFSSLEPLLYFGRWFFGLFASQSRSTAPQENIKEADRVRYVWEEQALPRLWETEGEAEGRGSDTLG